MEPKTIQRIMTPDNKQTPMKEAHRKERSVEKIFDALEYIESEKIKSIGLFSEETGQPISCIGVCINHNSAIKAVEMAREQEAEKYKSLLQKAIWFGVHLEANNIQRDYKTYPTDVDQFLSQTH